MRLGITTGSFFPKSTNETLKEISALGFRNVSINLQRFEFRCGIDITNSTFYKEMKGLLSEYSLEAVSTHSLFLIGTHVFNEKVRKKILFRSIEISKILETHILVLHPEYIFKNHKDALKFLSKPNKRYLIDGFKQIVDTAKDYGISLGIENVQHWDEFPLLNDPDSIQTVLNYLDNTGFVLDLFHSEMADNTLDFVNNVGDSIISIHLSDKDKNRRRILPGEGEIDLVEFILLLYTIGYDGPLMIELSNSFNLPRLITSKEYIEKILKSTC